MFIKSRICSTLSDSISNLSSGRHWPHGTELPPRTSSPLLGTVSRNDLRTLSSSCLPRDTFQATIHRVSPTTTTRPWRVSLPTRDVFSTRAAIIEFDLPLRLVPNFTNALTAESWCRLNLWLNSICACSLRDLVCQQLQRGFWINLQNCFRIRHPFDECSAHR